LNWIISRQRLALLLPAVIFSGACAKAENACPSAQGIALQILGPGGPIANDGRASSGYLVWVDGVARVLPDAGGGIFLRGRFDR
jgi:hypothetical protein